MLSSSLCSVCALVFPPEDPRRSKFEGQEPPRACACPLEPKRSITVVVAFRRARPTLLRKKQGVGLARKRRKGEERVRVAAEREFRGLIPRGVHGGFLVPCPEVGSVCVRVLECGARQHLATPVTEIEATRAERSCLRVQSEERKSQKFGEEKRFKVLNKAKINSVLLRSCGPRLIFASFGRKQKECVLCCLCHCCCCVRVCV